MVEFGEQSNLTIEGIRNINFLLCTQGNHVYFFDGNDFAMLLLITGFVDGAEAPFTDFGEDAITIRVARKKVIQVCVGIVVIFSLAIGILGVVGLVFHVSNTAQNVSPILSASPSITRNALITPTPTPSSTPSLTSSPASSSAPSPTLTINADTPTTVASTSLSNLIPIGGYPSDESTQPTNLDGASYVNLVRQDLLVCNNSSLDYDLEKKYSTFTAKAGLRDMYTDTNGTTATPWIFALYAVDANGERTLFKQIMKFGLVANVNVSVSGVLRLRLSIEWIDPGQLVTCSPYNSYDAVWADPTLTP